MNVKTQNGKLFVEIDLQSTITTASRETLVVVTTHDN